MQAYLPEVLERLRLHAVKGEDAALVEGGQVAGQVPRRGTALRQHRLQSRCEYGISLSMGHGLDRSDPWTHVDMSEILTRP